MSSCGRSAEIRVRNLQRIVPINAAALEKFAGKALPLCLALHKTKTTDLTRLREISVLIVSDRRIASLHRQFLNESGPTDVITFSHGEIFIGAETARRHAREFGKPLTHELRLYVIHGLLHLHGFDDSDRVAARKMEKAQGGILKRAELRLV
jgi:probable rRNA maturation factor